MTEEETNKKFDALFRKMDELVKETQASNQQLVRHDERISELQKDHAALTTKLWGVIAAVGTAIIAWVTEFLSGFSHRP